MKKRFNNLLKICTISLTVSLLISCNEEEATQIGYIDGEYTYISSNVSGVLHQLLVTRGQEIEQGQLLYQLDPEPEASSVKQVTANISNLSSQVDFYKTQLERQQFLLQENATSKMEVERAQTTYDSYVQQLAANQAQLVETQWTLDQKTKVAPVSGQVFDTFYRIGENVTPFQPVVAILDPKNIKVIFYVSEEKLNQIKIDQKISFSCDSCQGKTQATISYISPRPEYTPPIIYSKATRSKLVYAVHAIMPLEIAKKFHTGQPLDVYLDHE